MGAAMTATNLPENFDWLSISVPVPTATTIDADRAAAIADVAAEAARDAILARFGGAK